MLDLRNYFIMREEREHKYDMKHMKLAQLMKPVA